MLHNRAVHIVEEWSKLPWRISLLSVIHIFPRNGWNHLPTWIFEVFSTHLPEVFNNKKSAKIMPKSVWCLTWVFHTSWCVIKVFPLSALHKKKKILIPSLLSYRRLPLKFVSPVRESCTLEYCLLISILQMTTHSLLPPHHTSLLDLSASPFHYQ